MRNRLSGFTSHRPTFFKPVLTLSGINAGILHLLVGGDDDVALARALDRALAAIGLDGEIDHVKYPCVDDG